jgi:hypothetical protein
MSEHNATKSLRDRLASGTEDRLGKALTDLLENPLLTGAIGRAFDAREKASQAQELAMGALNLPSAADIERLTRRLRSLSQRLEGIEDGVDRLNRSLTTPKVEARLSSIEEQLQGITRAVGDLGRKTAAPSASRSAAPRATGKASGVKRPASKTRNAKSSSSSPAKPAAARRKG